MSPDQRREMIIRTAVPLVAEHGAAVTTGQIARAAGIGEATIFRVFADKDELLDACVAEVLRNDHVLNEIRSISLELPLAERLAEAGAAIDAYLARMGMVISALYASGRRGRGSHGGGEQADAGLDRTAAMEQTLEAISELFEPERESLRLPPEQISAVFMGLTFSRTRAVSETRVSVEDTIDMFLHGALKAEENA
ncbi:TetR/AcrR family transcriptional regulator [Actinomadura barringtoniae]|uniref:TetR/AcrR family transcriptional regulator n=2 Tax=Actinomadura barringtoniae TaxID=1427535 RepID=A0A939PM52_9ACTN|nr:TetR/AcrR family transcriptional regulator [Actinomadura barringtoniae]